MVFKLKPETAGFKAEPNRNRNFLAAVWRLITGHNGLVSGCGHQLNWQTVRGAGAGELRNYLSRDYSLLRCIWLLIHWLIREV